jgi:cyclase
MVKRIRVIPVLTIQGRKLVKTVQFKKPNYIGDPINAIKIFNDKEVDEIAVLDILASKERKEPNYNLIEEMAGECFIPLAYGGGITNFEQAQRIFALGVEKLILNSAVQDNMALINEIASAYGNQSVVVCMDIRKNIFGKRELYFTSGSDKSKRPYLQVLQDCVNAGAGEVIVQDIDKEGTFSGYNTDIISEIASQIPVPVIALGGAKSIDDMRIAITEGKASAVAAGSFFIYKNNDPKSILINYPSQEILEKEIFNKI